MPQNRAKLASESARQLKLLRQSSSRFFCRVPLQLKPNNNGKNNETKLNP
jgi:hypothetical protein